MSLQEQINSQETFKEQVEVLKNFYLLRKMDSPLEPEWIHLSYNLAFRYLSDEYLSDEDLLKLHSIVTSHSLDDGFVVPSIPGMPNLPDRIMHDGWKAGTATWVFMGRNAESAHILKNRWVAVNRSLPKDLFELIDNDGISDTLWIAYHLDHPFGPNDQQEFCVGPTMFYEDLKKVIQER